MTARPRTVAPVISRLIASSYQSFAAIPVPLMPLAVTLVPLPMVAVLLPPRKFTATTPPAPTAPALTAPPIMVMPGLE